MAGPWRFALVPLLLVGLAASAHAAPRRVPIGPPASALGFRAYGMGLMPIDATFTRFSGWLTYDPADHAACQVELTAEVASMVADDAAMRDRIIGPDFMDAAHFPTLTYAGACDAHGLAGTLGMHGVSRPFALSLTWARNGVEAEGRLVRAEWGMTAMPFLGGRTVRIRVTVPLG